jgi:hypothetical protein
MKLCSPLRQLTSRAQFSTDRMQFRQLGKSRRLGSPRGGRLDSTPFTRIIVPDSYDGGIPAPPFAASRPYFKT